MLDEHKCKGLTRAFLIIQARGMRYKSLDKFATVHRLLLTVSLFENKVHRLVIRIVTELPFSLYVHLREHRFKTVQMNLCRCCVF